MTTEHLPRVAAYIVTNRATGTHAAYVSCPFCGSVHKHGAGPADAPPDLGARGAHCAWGDGGDYILVPGLVERPADLSVADKNRRLLADDRRRGLRRWG